MDKAGIEVCVSATYIKLVISVLCSMSTPLSRFSGEKDNLSIENKMNKTNLSSHTY